MVKNMTQPHGKVKKSHSTDFRVVNKLLILLINIMSLKEDQEISLSGRDISKLLGRKCKIISYPQLREYSSIEELLEPYGYVVILALQAPRYGHWIAVLKVGKNKIEVFDSYGLGIDEELEFISDPSKRKILGMDKPYLTTRLLWECKDRYNLTINENKFQKKNKSISTCGRHVCVRIWNRNMSLNRYKKYLNSTRYNPDEL